MNRTCNLLFACIALFLCSHSVFALQLHNQINEFALKLHEKLDTKISNDPKDYKKHPWPGFPTFTTNLDGIGEVTYTLDEKRDGEALASSLGVDSSRFRIHFRGWGNYPLDSIEIPELGLKLQIYSDYSGTFVTKDGWLYTNGSKRIMGGSGDSEGDELFIGRYNFFYNGGRECDRPIKENGLGSRWFTALIFAAGPDRRLDSLELHFPEDTTLIKGACDVMGMPHRISWKETSETVMDWLNQNVLRYL